MGESQSIAAVAQVAGIGGIALLVLFYTFRSLIARVGVQKLGATQGTKVIRLIAWLVWSVTIISIAAWVFVKYLEREPIRCAGAECACLTWRGRWEGQLISSDPTNVGFDISFVFSQEPSTRVTEALFEGRPWPNNREGWTTGFSRPDTRVWMIGDRLHVDQGPSGYLRISRDCDSARGQGFHAHPDNRQRSTLTLQRAAQAGRTN